MNRAELGKFGEVKVVKNYSQVLDKSLKKALIMKKCVHLEDTSKTYKDLPTRIFTAEEIKKRHMGKIKCVVKYKNDEELKLILETYFS